MIVFTIKLFYQNQACRAFPVSKKQLKMLTLLLVRHLPLPLKGFVNLNIIDQKKMRTIAKAYYPFKRHPADVLSFRYNSFAQINRLNPLLGEVFLSWPQIQRQAQTFKHSLERESSYLLVHGLLHLLGYEHQTTLTKQMMRYWEEFLLARLDQKAFLKAKGEVFPGN